MFTRTSSASTMFQLSVSPSRVLPTTEALQLLAPLPNALRDEIAALWDEYEAAASPEAKLAKGLDKLETIMQHNQGLNPPDFDYRFNLGYGRRHTADIPLVAQVREILDRETEARAVQAEVREPPEGRP